MLITRHGFHAFNEYDLRANLDKFLSDLRTEIEADSSVSTAEEEEYVQRKKTERTFDGLKLDTENIKITQKEEMISSEYFPHSFDVDRGRSFPKPVVTFHVPFTGDAKFFQCYPSTRIMMTHEVAVEQGNIIFEVINFSNDAEQVKRQRDEVVQYLTGQTNHVNSDIAGYNNSLEGVIREAFQRAKAKFKSQTDFLEQLNG